MYLSKSEYSDLYKFGHDTVRDSWRCKLFLRNPVVRDWLVKNACDGINAKCQLFSDASNTSVRESLAAQVYEYVESANKVSSGGEVTFVILPIILAAVLSWLIQKLLDHLFGQEDINADDQW